MPPAGSYQLRLLPELPGRSADSGRYLLYDDECARRHDLPTLARFIFGAGLRLGLELGVECRHRPGPRFDRVVIRLTVSWDTDAP